MDTECFQSRAGTVGKGGAERPVVAIDSDDVGCVSPLDMVENKSQTEYALPIISPVICPSGPQTIPFHKPHRKRCFSIDHLTQLPYFSNFVQPLHLCIFHTPFSPKLTNSTPRPLTHSIDSFHCITFQAEPPLLLLHLSWPAFFHSLGKRRAHSFFPVKSKRYNSCGFSFFAWKKRHLLAVVCKGLTRNA